MQEAAAERQQRGRGMYVLHRLITPLLVLGVAAMVMHYFTFERKHHDIGTSKSVRVSRLIGVTNVSQQLQAASAPCNRTLQWEVCQAFGYGFASQYNNMLLGYLVANAEKRSFIVANPFPCRYPCGTEQHTSCFNTSSIPHELCSSIRYNRKDLRHQAQEWESRKTIRTPHVVVSQDASFWSVRRLVRSKLGRRPGAKWPFFGQELDLFEAKVEAIRRLWFPQPWVIAQVQEILQLNGWPKQGVCGFHIRRGDKMTEAAGISVRRYIEILLKRSQGRCQTCLIASDEPQKVLPEFQQVARQLAFNCRVLHLMRPAEGRRSLYQDSATEEGTLLLLAELEALASADWFVGTYSSNIGRLVQLLRAAKGHPFESGMSADGAAWDPWR